uniref:NADH dehydrogenase subunit 5 n=1 Tax=Psyllopsis discrepans TaxID=2283586 RepID=UPI002A823E4C|nr:NADH dehydrogenase subunit 5 [Psyllopsis discrepans]WON66126.1 NADH dehydrogenase subunit 5 [Psyllopsis discrepans]
MSVTSKFYFMSFFMIISYLILFFIGSFYLNLNKIVLLEFELLSVNSISFSFIMYLDWISIYFSLIVMMISSLILIYSKEYMMKECNRFLWMTLFFIFFMIIMIYSPSILGVVLGWDGLGIISYCLVIYYQNKDSFNSGFITAASNRFGDSMLMLSIAWFSMKGMYMFWELGDGILFFMMACMTKSAQFPFSAWLPAAMAAPTPISSLVHSSTLVTAGVYMLIRFYWCLVNSEGLLLVLIFSLITITVAGISALQEYDLKRTVALSTLGQLGFMMMILSLGHLSVSFFHLLIHALFKALLFMCSGAIIHSGSGCQDMRKMGNLSIIPSVKISLNISMFSLMGVPFSSGFYSKDSLLELCLCSYGGWGVGGFMLMSALITITYSMRVLYFLSSSNFWIVWEFSSKNLYISIFCLMMLNITAGGVLNWMIMDYNIIILTSFLKWMILMIIILGVIWHGLLSLNVMMKVYLINLLFILSLTKMLSMLIKMFLKSAQLLDQGWLEGSIMYLKKLSVEASLWTVNLLGGGGSNYMMSIGVLVVMIMLI